MSERSREPSRRTTAGAWRWLVSLAVIAVAVGVYVMRPAADAGDTAAATAAADGPTAGSALPRLVDLGADKCIPCKLMKPILDELRTEYAGTIDVEFIDVWKNTDASAQYGITVIPTQIFYAADGTELFRHEGYYGREDILAKWRELGLEI